ncbi:hypothetical protein SynA1524_01865 [Synechococcus sp. A15-24]|nr:hypothetical protein SynA1524_01865 [Synechococcus sp. A15-24]
MGLPVAMVRRRTERRAQKGSPLWGLAVGIFRSPSEPNGMG